MQAPFYTQQQLRFFCTDLTRAYLRAGFEIVDEPHIDFELFGFRATYVRRYVFQKPSLISDGILTTFVHVVGIPFGCHSDKMVILSTPKDVQNAPIIETVKLRVHFDKEGQCRVICGDTNSKPTTASRQASGKSAMFEAPAGGQEAESRGHQSNQQPPMMTTTAKTTPEHLWPNLDDHYRMDRLQYDLARYLSRIIEIISPGLIELPLEMKLEILKKLNIDSIMRMAQVNNEFKAIIFEHGETLWRHLCYRDFDIKSINRFVHRSWMELYRDSYILHQLEICRKERALPGLPERPALPPAPNRLQIEWFPAVLELPYYPIHEDHEDPIEVDEHLHLALQLAPLRRADSLDSLHQ